MIKKCVSWRDVFPLTYLAQPIRPKLSLGRLGWSARVPAQIVRSKQNKLKVNTNSATEEHQNRLKNSEITEILKILKIPKAPIFGFKYSQFLKNYEIEKIVKIRKSRKNPKVCEILHKSSKNSKIHGKVVKIREILNLTKVYVLISDHVSNKAWLIKSWVSLVWLSHCGQQKCKNTSRLSTSHGFIWDMIWNQT